MELLDPVFAGDVAVLAAASALLHYALGLYGMVVVFALLAFVENGASLWKELSQRCFQLWHALSTRSTSDGADAKKPKTLDRQQTWHFGRPATPRDERTRSDARTELAEDDEADDVSDLVNDQLLETANANTANSANDMNPDVPPMDPLTQQLLARLSIRDVASAGDNVVAVNARAPVVFETDLFAGHALFLVRTAPEDPHYASLFLGKRRMFWIQVQGRFKRRPRGPVFLGGELPGRISLGLFTKSIARVILGIVQSLLGNVYMSFGAASSGDADALDELPAVAFPLYQSVDQFMVTPAGETPPPLGTLDFGESDQARARRRQTPFGRGGDHVFDVGPTYSFHFHTMYVDLAQWKTANLPGLSDMQLATFFDSLPLRLVAYDVGEKDSGSHLQQHKQYLFNFEVAFDVQRPRGMWRSDSEQSLASSSSESTGMASTTESTASSSSTSPFPTVVAGDDQVAIHDGLATVDRENARALQNIELQYLFWMEEVDLEMGVRRVQYVFRLRENCGAGEGEDDREKRVTEQLVVVSAYRLRLLLGSKFRRLRRLYTLQSLRFHTRSRIDSYSIICDEARSVAVCLERILSLSRGTDPYTYSEDNEALVVAFESALYQLLTVRSHLQLPHDGAALSTELTPAAIGAKLSQRDRDTIGVVSEGVVYRFYGDSLVRQELLVLTPEALLFYRSQSSSPDKTIKCNSVIGVQTTRVPYASSSGGDFAWAFQINTFAEEMLVCVATEHVRNTWIRVVLQQSSPHANFDRSFLAPLAVCFTPTKPLKPANRVELNSRSLFPRRNSRSMDQDAVAMVSTALRSALRVHALEERADVMTILEFLNHASALRTIDLARVMDRPHEERLAFFLNLYHVVLAHAMIAHGFPRTKAQWEDFQTHMCYVVGKDPRDAQQSLSLSLAEIEHVILRARLPPASELPHLRLSSLSPEFASRLTPLGMAHPDFRVSFALLMNHDRKSSQDVTVFHGDTIHEQLNAVVKGYVAQHVEIDTLRKTIFLPRICEWFKHDFGGGGSPLYCVRKLLGFLDDAVQQQALEVLDSPTLVHIKYGAFTYVPRTTLRLARPAIGNHADER